MREGVARIPHREMIWWIQAAGASIGMMICAFFLPGGDDLYRYYIPFVNGCLECGYVPYYACWFLWPLHMLPGYPYAWPVWTILNVLGFMLLSYFTGINPILFMVSFPMLGQIWLGQIDVLICLGIVIFLFARNPYWRGLGIILALTKPQLTALPLFYGMLHGDPKTLWKQLVIPAFVVAISFIVYGLAWPVDWIANATKELPVHVWRLASMDVWKVGLILLPVPFFITDERKRVEAGLLVSALATPYFGVYSYVSFLLLNTRWWSLPLSYAWLLGYFWFKESAMRFTWILPLALLVALVRESWAERRKPICHCTEMQDRRP